MTEFADGADRMSRAEAGGALARLVRWPALDTAIASAARDLGATTGTVPRDPGARPPDTPQLTDLADAVRGVRCADRALVVDYDPVVDARLADAVTAEGRCCPGVDWSLERSDSPRIEPVSAGHRRRLRVVARPEQLTVLRLRFPRLPTGEALEDAATR